jgi:hypothetical protein
MRLPSKVLPWRHMVEPQSPLCWVRKSFRITIEYTPEVGDDLVSAVGHLLVLLWGALGDLEAVLGEDGVAGVGAATDFATVDAMAEDLCLSGH